MTSTPGDSSRAASASNRARAIVVGRIGLGGGGDHDASGIERHRDAKAVAQRRPDEIDSAPTSGANPAVFVDRGAASGAEWRYQHVGEAPTGSEWYPPQAAGRCRDTRLDEIVRQYAHVCCLVPMAIHSSMLLELQYRPLRKRHSRRIPGTSTRVLDDRHL